ncbi:MAG TPA: lysylphosphatidylglycerol synthase domain-containing protein [Polyangiaceae bacterium]|nr:lysylphosphatidylglycerol synthase domain-containing protein [Polyangiaceae bacterium]
MLSRRRPLRNLIESRRVRACVRWLLPPVVAVLLFASLWREFPQALATIGRTRPLALLALPLFVIWNQVATVAWQRLLRAAGASEATLSALVRFRIEAQAINQLVPSAGLAGEVMRTASAAGSVRIVPAALATTLDNVAGTAAGLVFALAAITPRLLSPAGDGDFAKLALAGGLGLSLLASVCALPFLAAPRFLARFAPEGLAHEFCALFVERDRALRRALRHALALRLMERVLGAAEMYVLFRATGQDVSLADAALVSAVIVLVSFAAFFLPGQIGVAETAVSSVGVLLGIPAAAGLSAALLRRARQLVVCLVGVVSLLVRRFGLRPVQPPACGEAS